MSVDTTIVPPEIVSVFCSLLGAIIERKRVESKQAKISEGLRAVVAIADELISCPDTDAICRRTVDLAREKLDLNRCAIFLRDGDVLRGRGVGQRGAVAVDDLASQRVQRDRVDALCCGRTGQVAVVQAL